MKLAHAFLWALATIVLSGRAFADGWPTAPDHSLTPGKTVNISLNEICTTSWGTDARHVTNAMKQQVIDAYHFDVSNCPKSHLNGKLVSRVEIDHLVPRSLGGGDDVANLWPECYELTEADKSQQEDGAHKKDRLEQGLSKTLCKSPSKAKLKQYQLAFKADWLALYRTVYGDK